MKIAITGAMGVGKTTLANHIAEANGFTLLPEVARILIDEGYKLDEGTTVEIEYEILKRQKLLEDHEGPYISDRCLVDLMAYCAVLFPEEKELLFEIARTLKDAKYDAIIYVAPEFALEDDGERSVNPEFQTAIDDRIKDILESLKIKWHKVTGSREDRLNQVLKIINEHEKEKEIKTKA